MNTEHIFPQDKVQQWANNSLRDSLALSFSHYVAENIDWSKARFYALAEIGIPVDSLLNFRTGGKTSGEPRPDDWLINSVNAVRGTRNNFFLIEDWLARPEDGFISSFSMPAVFKEKEVYYVAKDDPRRVANWGRICSNSVPLFHGFLVEDDAMPSPGDVLSDERLQALAKCVRIIFFGIYDGESYLLCSLDQ
jgi:hypothetical protein